MPRTQFRLTPTAAIATGTSAKTVLQVVAGSDHRVTITRWSIGFAGISATAAPIKVDLVRQTDAGTSSALTPVKADDSIGDSLRVTARHTATDEPTTTDVLFSIYVHPQGRYESLFPEQVGAGDRVGIRVTAAADVNCLPHISGEE